MGDFGLIEAGLIGFVFIAMGVGFFYSVDGKESAVTVAKIFIPLVVGLMGIAFGFSYLYENYIKM